jgi:hypothetical protein
MESGGIDPLFLTSALGGDEWSASRSCRCISEEKTLSTHCIGAWVGPRADLDAVEYIQILTIPGIEPRLLSRPVRILALYRLGYRNSQYR